MKNYNNITEIWDAIDKGSEVFWGNDSYHITVEDCYPDNEYQKNHFTNRHGKVLRVTCISNYFGSLLTPDEIPNLFSK